MKKIIGYSFIIFLVASAFVRLACADEKYIPVKGITHINSNVSSGKYPPSVLVDIAGEKGVDAIFVADNYAPQWEYGMYPFRGVIKRKIAYPGIFRYGPDDYQKLMDRLDRKNTSIHVFGSAEVAPFYYWTGSPFSKDLTLNDWDLQFLVFALEGNEYKGIRNISTGGFAGFGPMSLLIFIPLALIFFGAFSLRIKSSRFYISDPLSWAIIALGFVVFLMLFPFKTYRYDQYSGRSGPGPYQEVIDYVNEKGGMTFWSAPEAYIQNKKIGPVFFSCPTALEYMGATHGYTGFCVLYEGYKKIAAPGGLWDEKLMRYCHGKEENPVWAIGEVSYHDENISGGKEIDDVQTVFFVEEVTKEYILEAMRDGRMYAVRRGKDHVLILGDFYVVNESGSKTYMGGEAVVSGDYTVSFNVGWEEGAPAEPVKAALIKDGDVVGIFDITSAGTYEFSGKPVDGKGYYRLDIRGEYPSMLFSNPIFVSGKDNN